jgi:hypothetical protein
MTDQTKYLCRTCGLNHYPDLPWGEDGKQPSHIICDCCGVEFGYGDSGASVNHLAEMRKYWVEIENCKWNYPKNRPANWDMAAQIRGIAPEFKGPDDEKLIAFYLERHKI